MWQDGSVPVTPNVPGSCSERAPATDQNVQVCEFNVTRIPLGEVDLDPMNAADDLDMCAALYINALTDPDLVFQYVELVDLQVPKIYE